MKRFLYLALTIVVSAAALAYALRGADLAQIGALLSGGNYWVLPPFLLALLLTYLVNAVRWAVILHPLGRFHWQALVPSMMIGFAANNLFPARLGEFARAVLFARQFRQSSTAALMTLVLERMLDVVVILIFYGVAVLLLGQPPEAIRLATQIAGIALLAGFALLALLVAWPGMALGLWGRCARWLPHKLAQRGTSVLHNALAALGILRSVKGVLGLVLLSILRWLFLVAMLVLSLIAYGVWPSVGLALLVFVVTSLAVALPSTPGYVGTLQAAFVFALVPFGIRQEVALASSVLFLVVTWVPVTAVGLLFLVLQGLRVADLRHDVEEIEADVLEP